MPKFKKGDLVRVTIRDTMPGPHPNRPVGTFKATVLNVAPTVGEVDVVPEDWDEACDVLDRERSMSWSEIRDLRHLGHLDNLQDEDVELISRPVSRAELHAAIDAKIEQMWIELADEFGVESGDTTPALETLVSSIRVLIQRAAEQWYELNTSVKLV